MVTSPRLSFKGYNILTALYRNKDSIKIILGVLGAYSTYLSISGFDWKSFLLALLTAVGGLGIKLLTDALDYFFSEVTLS